MRKSLIVAVVAGLVVAAAAPADAGTTQVSGIQTPVASADPCIAADPSSLATFRMDGTLIGCWYTDEFALREHPSG